MTLTVISTLIGCLFSFFVGRYFALRKRKAHQKIKELEDNVEYLEKISYKPTEFLRHAISKIFLVLFLLSTGLFSPVVISFIGQNILGSTMLNGLSLWFKFLFLFGATLTSFLCFRDFNDVVNIKTAKERHARKIQKLKEKIKHT